LHRRTLGQTRGITALAIPGTERLGPVRTQLGKKGPGKKHGNYGFRGGGKTSRKSSTTQFGNVNSPLGEGEKGAHRTGLVKNSERKDLMERQDSLERALFLFAGKT